MKRLFNKLPGVQQGILLICFWAVLLFWGVGVLGEGRDLYDVYNEQADLIRRANEKLSQLPAIEKAIQEVHKLDMNSVNAQQARRIIDRLIGFKLSPCLPVLVFLFLVLSCLHIKFLHS